MNISLRLFVSCCVFAVLAASAQAQKKAPTKSGGVDEIYKLLRDEPQLGAVMVELTLRSARDDTIAAILRETYAAWHRTMRGLLRHGAREGGLSPELDSDGVAALVVATLTAMMLPTITASPQADLALRQLERFLGLRPAPAASSN